MRFQITVYCIILTIIIAGIIYIYLPAKKREPNEKVQLLPNLENIINDQALYYIKLPIKTGGKTVSITLEITDESPYNTLNSKKKQLTKVVHQQLELPNKIINDNYSLREKLLTAINKSIYPIWINNIYIENL